MRGSKGQQGMKATTTPNRVVALDGLRGLAALVVVLGHGLGAIEIPGVYGRLLWVHSPLAVVINAIGAVHLFFVLSGYCLAGSVRRGQHWLDVAQFYLRRVFRIQPPYMIAVVFTWLLSLFYVVPEPGHGVSLEYIKHLRVQISPVSVLSALKFPGIADGLMPHGYTLEVEMIFSFLLPLLMWVSRRFHWSLLLLLSLWALWSQHPIHASQRYALDFTLGIGIYQEHDRIARLFARLPTPGVLALLAAGLAVFTYPTYSIQMFDRWAIMPFAVGGSVLVAGAIHSSRFAAMLAARPVAALGRTSYSIYLFHFGVLCWLTRLIPRQLGVWEGAGFIGLVVACTLLISAGSYRGIERPSIRLGNRLCAWLAGSFGQRARLSHRFIDDGAPE
jgi:peptidoglycan/LPS O-acetylase OafA/YrhL